MRKKAENRPLIVLKHASEIGSRRRGFVGTIHYPDLSHPMGPLGWFPREWWRNFRRRRGYRMREATGQYNYRSKRHAKATAAA